MADGVEQRTADLGGLRAMLFWQRWRPPLGFWAYGGWEELLLAGFGRVGDGLVMVRGGAWLLDLVVVFLCFLCLDVRWRDLARWAKGFRGTWPFGCGYGYKRRGEVRLWMRGWNCLA